MLLPAVRLGLVAAMDGSYAFAHDRIQEAAYSLIPKKSRAASHLRLGRLLQAQIAPQQRDEHIFEIVHQLNRGVELIELQEERERLAELNLVAGLRSRASSAYASALTYLATGTALLAEDRWERHYALAFRVGTLPCGMRVPHGRPDTAAEQRLLLLSHRAVNATDRAAVACLRINLQSTLDGSERGVRIGLEFLQSVGVAWSPHPPRDEMRREFDQMWRRLGNRPIRELMELQRMTDQ